MDLKVLKVPVTQAPVDQQDVWEVRTPDDEDFATCRIFHDHKLIHSVEFATESGNIEIDGVQLQAILEIVKTGGYVFKEFNRK